MAEIKISDLTAKSANLSNTDLFAIAESDGAGGYTSKKITGQEIAAIAGENIYLVDGTVRSDRTIDLNGVYLTFQHGSADVFKISAADVISFNNSYSFPTADGASGQVLKTDGAGALSFGLSAAGLYAQTVVSPTLTNTTTETSIVGTGVGSLAVPANAFVVGDSYHAKVSGFVSCLINSDITIRLKSGSVILADSGILTLPLLTNKIIAIEFNSTIRQIGASGVAEITTMANYTIEVGGILKGVSFSLVNNTTFDTTISNTLDITAEWGQADAADQIYSANFVLHKTY
jgi:hypothetical protein